MKNIKKEDLRHAELVSASDYCGNSAENPPFTSPLYKGGQKPYTSLVKTLPSKQLSIVCERKGPLAVVGLKEMGQKAAFTLAEVLITLGVIGVVAAITLPSFIQNHQTKVRNEQNRMVQYKLTKATDQMKSLGLIGNYATTKDFVNELKKHFKIVQICENDNLEQCWPTKVIATDGSEVKIADIKDGSSLNPTGWTKETLGIITADGTPMIITYKDDCPALEAEKTYTWQTEDNKPVTNATTSCIAAIYDLNGKGRPNKSGEDVRLFNAVRLGNAGLQCKTWTDSGGNSANDKTGGLCLSDYISYQPMQHGSEEYTQFIAANTIEPCPAEYEFLCKPDDYWVGAFKACQDAGGRLPSAAELAAIANSMFGTSISAYGSTGIQTLKEDPYNLSKGVYLWSDNLRSSYEYSAYNRYFINTHSSANYNNRKYNGISVRCVK